MAIKCLGLEGGGHQIHQSGNQPYQGGILPLLALGELMPSFVKKLDGGSKRKHRTVIKSSLVVTPTLKQLLPQQGRCNAGVLPEMISVPQVGQDETIIILTCLQGLL